MKKIHSLFVVFGCAALLLAAGCGSDAGDIAFVKKTFRDLIRGQYAARHVIAWSEFLGMDINVGEEYKGMPDEAARVKYQRNFIDAFKAGFAYMKADPRKITNFRVIKRPNAAVTIVGMDIKGSENVLAFAVKRKGGRRFLTEIQVLQVQDRAAFEAAVKEAQLGHLAPQ